MAESNEAQPTVERFSEDVFDKVKLVILKVLGRGLSGDVVLAQGAHEPKYLVALKAIPLLDKRYYVKNKVLFEREVSIMQLLQHPHLMKGFMAAECPYRLYIMMEYYPRGSLEKGLTNLTFLQTERYLVQLVSAVKYMHSQGIVHCDIKLPNILVRTESHVTLADFGLSLRLSVGRDRIPIGKMGGTKAYLSPERKNGKPHLEIDPKKADVYALGVSLWGMTFRINPEKGSYDFIMEIHNKEAPSILKKIGDNQRLMKANLNKMLAEIGCTGALAQNTVQRFNGCSIRVDLADSNCDVLSVGAINTLHLTADFMFCMLMMLEPNPDERVSSADMAEYLKMLTEWIDLIDLL